MDMREGGKIYTMLHRTQAAWIFFHQGFGIPRPSASGPRAERGHEARELGRRCRAERARKIVGGRTREAAGEEGEVDGGGSVRAVRSGRRCPVRRAAGDEKMAEEAS
jgi:hypothetical protein